MYNIKTNKYTINYKGTKHIQTIITPYLKARTCELCSTLTPVLWVLNTHVSLDNSTNNT